MRYRLTFQPCQTCDRETLHVGRPQRPLRWLIAAVFALGRHRRAAANQPPSRCACCGTIPNPDGRHPLRLQLDAAESRAGRA